MKKLIILLFLVSSLQGFISYEHELIGNAAKLHGIEKDSFQMDNGLELTFGQLVTMGDYFGKKNESIVLDLKTQKPISDYLILERRFLDIYNSLSKGSYPEGILILKEMEKEKKAIEDAIASGKSEHEAYSKICPIENIDLTLITEGFYLTLSSTNFDHFVNPGLKVAENAFFAGYRLALKTVENAYDVESLKKAYAIYGFASHYLTDIFSAGHMRVPRFELWQQVKCVGATQISGLLALYQHQEDGFFGVNVKNKFAAWTAYGDACLLEHAGEENIAISAIQKGIDEIYNLFLKKSTLEECCLAMEDFLPIAAGDNFSPLFKIDEKTNKVLRRKDVTDRFCKEYISNWYALTTLLKLYFYQIGEGSSFLSKEHLEKIKSYLCQNLIKSSGKSSSLKQNPLLKIKQIAQLPEIPDEELVSVFEGKTASLSEDELLSLSEAWEHLRK